MVSLISHFLLLSPESLAEVLAPVLSEQSLKFFSAIWLNLSVQICPAGQGVYILHGAEVEVMDFRTLELAVVRKVWFGVWANKTLSCLSQHWHLFQHMDGSGPSDMFVLQCTSLNLFLLASVFIYLSTSNTKLCTQSHLKLQIKKSPNPLLNCVDIYNWTWYISYQKQEETTFFSFFHMFLPYFLLVIL